MHCSDSPFICGPVGHTIAGGQSIFNNISQREVLVKGVNHRESKSINWRHNFEIKCLWIPSGIVPDGEKNVTKNTWIVLPNYLGMWVVDVGWNWVETWWVDECSCNIDLPGPNCCKLCLHGRYVVFPVDMAPKCKSHYRGSCYWLITSKPYIYSDDTCERGNTQQSYVCFVFLLEFQPRTKNCIFHNSTWCLNCTIVLTDSVIKHLLSY